MLQHAKLTQARKIKAFNIIPHLLLQFHDLTQPNGTSKTINGKCMDRIDWFMKRTQLGWNSYILSKQAN